MKAIVQAIGVPALACARAADGGIIVVAVNDDACRLFGVEPPPGDVRLSGLLPAAVACELEQAVARCLGGAADIGTEHVLGHADGRLRRVRMRHRPLGAQGVVSTIVQAEEEGACTGACAHRRRADLAVRLVAGGGHALNNHLHPILSLSRRLQERAPADARETLPAIIRDAALRMRDVTEILASVLGVGRARAADQAPVAVDALVRDVLRAAQLILPPRLALSAEVAAADAAVAGCRAELLQLLLALVLDAADRQPAEGEVLLRVARCKPAARETPPQHAGGDWLEIAVGRTPAVASDDDDAGDAGTEARIFLPEIRDASPPAA